MLSAAAAAAAVAAQEACGPPVSHSSCPVSPVVHRLAPHTSQLFVLVPTHPHKYNKTACCLLLLLLLLLLLQLMTRADRLSATAVALSAWSFTALRHAHPTLFGVLSKRVAQCQQQGRLSVTDARQLLYAAAKLGVRDTRLVKACVEVGEGCKEDRWCEGIGGRRGVCEEGGGALLYHRVDPHGRGGGEAVSMLRLN